MHLLDRECVRTLRPLFVYATGPLHLGGGPLVLLSCPISWYRDRVFLLCLLLVNYTVSQKMETLYSCPYLC